MQVPPVFPIQKDLAYLVENLTCLGKTTRNKEMGMFGGKVQIYNS